MSLSTRAAGRLPAIAAVGALIGVAGAAIAVPIVPSYRGDPNSVQVQFDWISDTEPDWELAEFNTVGDEYPLHETAPFAMDNGGDISIEIPNFVDDLDTKEMRINMEFDGEVPGNFIDVAVNAFDDPATPLATEEFRTTTTDTSHYIDFEIHPNPDWEAITIFADPDNGIVPGNLTQITIDTVSVPAPGAAAIPAIAGLAAVGRRRR